MASTATKWSWPTASLPRARGRRLALFRPHLPPIVKLESVDVRSSRCSLSFASPTLPHPHCHTSRQASRPPAIRPQPNRPAPPDTRPARRVEGAESVTQTRSAHRTTTRGSADRRPPIRAIPPRARRTPLRQPGGSLQRPQGPCPTEPQRLPLRLARSTPRPIDRGAEEQHEPELQRSRFGHNGLTEWLNGASRAGRRPRPSAPKGHLTWAFAGAAYRNRTDDLLITSKTRVVRNRSRQCVPAGQGPFRRRSCPSASVPVHRFGSLAGSSPGLAEAP